MRVVVQRVSEARVEVDGTIVGRIERGLLVLVGLAVGDDEATLAWMARKVAGLRAAKYWPPVKRVDAVYGDRHFSCALPPE